MIQASALTVRYGQYLRNCFHMHLPNNINSEIVNLAAVSLAVMYIDMPSKSRSTKMDASGYATLPQHSERFRGAPHFCSPLLHLRVGSP
jgi:hypothetical protein